MTQSSDEKPETTRESLMRCAESLFARQGFDGTSVKEIAEAAGVNVSLISYHFNGKEGLYRSCIEQFGQWRLDVAKRILQPASTVEELRIRIDLFVDEMLSTYAHHSSACKMIQREADLGLPVAQDVFKETFLKIFMTLVEFISVSQSRGAVRSDLDPLLMAKLIYGGVVHVLHTDSIAERFFGKSIKDPEVRKHTREHFLQITLEGILPNSPRTP